MDLWHVTLVLDSAGLFTSINTLSDLSLHALTKTGTFSSAKRFLLSKALFSNAVDVHTCKCRLKVFECITKRKYKTQIATFSIVFLLFPRQT